jgi:hypothetical protein
MLPALVSAVLAPALAAEPVDVSRELQNVFEVRAVSIGVVAPNFSAPTMIAHVGDVEALAFRVRALTVIPTDDGSFTSWGAVGLRLPPYESELLQPYVMFHPMNGTLEAGARVTPLPDLAVDLQGAYNPKDGAAWGAALFNLGDVKRGDWEAPHTFVLGMVGAGADTRGVLALRASVLEMDIKGTFLTGLGDVGAEGCDAGACMVWLSTLPLGVRLPPASSRRAWLAYKFHWLPLTMGSRTGVHTVEGNLDITQNEPHVLFRLALDVGEGIQAQPVRTATLSIGWGTSRESARR